MTTLPIMCTATYEFGGWHYHTCNKLRGHIGQHVCGHCGKAW